MRRRESLGWKWWVGTAAALWMAPAQPGILPGPPVGTPSAEAPAVPPAFNQPPSGPSAPAVVSANPDASSEVSGLAKHATVYIQVFLDGTNYVPEGSGFLISPGGYIITNGHLVSGMVTDGTEERHFDIHHIEVYVDSGQPTQRLYMAGAPPVYAELTSSVDLALLKIDGQNLPYLNLAPTSSVQAGDPVWALGYPMGGLNALDAQRGRGPPVQAVRGNVLGFTYDVNGKAALVRHNAPIVKGNSGGPLLNSAGEVVGLNTWAIPGPDRLDVSSDAVLQRWESFRGGVAVQTLSAGSGQKKPIEIGQVEPVKIGGGEDPGLPLSSISRLAWSYEVTHLTHPSVGPDGTIFVDWREYQRARSAGAARPGERAARSGTVYQVVAVHPDGTTKWKQRVLDSIVPPVAANSDGTAFFASRDHVYFLDSAQKLHVFKAPAAPMNPPVAYRTNHVLISGSYNRLDLWEPRDNGSSWRAEGVWTKSVGAYGGLAVGSDGTVYFVEFGAARTDSRRLDAVGPDGKLRWSFESDQHELLQGPPVLGPDGVLYVQGYSKGLFALNPDGALKWSYPLNPSGDSRPAVLPDGRVIAVNRGDEKNGDSLFAFSSAGRLVWEFKLDQPVNYFGDPVVAPDGTIYVTAHLLIGSTGVETLYAVSSTGKVLWKVSSIESFQRSIGEPAVGPDGKVYLVVRDRDRYFLVSLKP